MVVCVCVSHASKIVLKILTHRLESKAEMFLEKDQYGFRKGRERRDAIAALRVMYERRLEHHKKVYGCYVDFKKAFDCVNWYKLMTILQSMGVDWRDRKLIWNLYNGQKAYVQIGEEQSGACSIGRGVRQGCLSPLLFIIYDEAMVKEAISNSEHGVHVGGQAVNMIR